MTLSCKKPSAFVILGLTLVLFLLTVHQYSKKFDKNYTGFACIGDRHPAPGFISEDAFVLKNSDGYDGHFFYLIAHDPLMTTAAPQFIDAPAYRYQRILYPSLSKLLTLGHPELLPYTLVAVNILAILGGSYFIYLFIQKAGLNPWLTLFYPFFGGFLLCTLRDLSDPVALCFLTSSFYYSEQQKPFFLSLCLALMLLSREFFMIFIPFFLLDTLWLRPSKKQSASVLFSLLPLLLWEGYIYHRLGVVPFTAGTGNFSFPLQGFLETTLPLFLTPGGFSEKIYRLVTVFSILASVFTAGFALWKKRELLSFCFALCTLLPFFLSGLVWVEFWSYGRVLLPFHLTTLLTAIRHKTTFFWIPLIPLPFLFLLMLIKILFC